MLCSAGSVATLCVEQKIVPELPILKLSRTLSGAAARHRLVDVLIETDRRGVDKAQRGIDLAVVAFVVVAVALVALIALVALLDRDLFRVFDQVRHPHDRARLAPERTRLAANGP